MRSVSVQFFSASRAFLNDLILFVSFSAPVTKNSALERLFSARDRNSFIALDFLIYAQMKNRSSDWKSSENSTAGRIFCDSTSIFELKNFCFAVPPFFSTAEKPEDFFTSTVTPKYTHNEESASSRASCSLPPEPTAETNSFSGYANVRERNHIGSA